GTVPPDQPLRLPGAARDLAAGPRRTVVDGRGQAGAAGAGRAPVRAGTAGAGRPARPVDLTAFRRQTAGVVRRAPLAALSPAPLQPANDGWTKWTIHPFRTFLAYSGSTVPRWSEVMVRPVRTPESQRRR